MPNHLTSAALLASLVLLPTVAAAEPVRPRTPIETSASETPSIVFHQLFFEVDEADKIGGLKDKFVEIFNDELRRVGYNVPKKVSSVFKKDQLPDTEFVLAGKLVEFDCTGRMDDTCGLTVEWELLHRASDSVVYRVTARHEEMKLEDMTKDSAAKAILLGPLHSLLSRKRFVEAVQGGSTGGESAKTGYERRVIKQCSTDELTMPKDSEKALGATAVIKSGKGVGSAVFVSPDGFLLTAAHVATKDTVEVRMREGEVKKARVIRLDEKRDIALLKLEDVDSATPCLRLDAESASAGQNVYAIGSPGGEELSFSISRGIVSGKRTFNETSYIQTDAAINPGNSGGPLVSDSGQVMGIASWKVGGETVEGLGFAVPSSTALEALAIQFGDETETIAPAVQRGTDDSNVYVDSEDPEWFYVGDDAPGKRPGWVGPVRFWGYATLGAGITAVAYTWLLHSGSDDVEQINGYESNRKWNTIGWGVSGLGLGMVLSSYFFNPKRTPPDTESATSEESSVTAHVGLTGFSLNVSF